MNKFKTILGSAVLALFSMTAANAGGLGIGISGTGIFMEGSGKETLKTTGVVSDKKDYGQGFGVASGYVQYQFGDNGFAVGVELIPGAATIVDRLKSERDWVGGDTTAADNVNQVIKAELSDHKTFYVESPGFGPAGFHIKLGYTEVKVKTQESLGTGTSYGDATINGGTVGIGFKGVAENGLAAKWTAEYTDYDTISLTGSADADSVSNKIEGDIETWGMKVSFGYQF